MEYSILGFITGLGIASSKGLQGSQAARVAIIPGIIGFNIVSLVLAKVVADQEAESIPPIDPAPVDLVDVPDVTNSTADEARRTVEVLGLLVLVQEVRSIADPGLVVAQDPVPHSRVVAGSTVTLFVSKVEQPPAETRVLVPNVTQQLFSGARETLQDEDFKVSRREESNSDVPKDYVIRTEPTAGTLVEPESRVTVVVSSGRPPE